MTTIHTTERINDAQRDSAVRLAQTTQRFASMFIGRKVGVRLSDKQFAPAWSTHNTIEFSESQLPDLSTIEGVLAVKGLTFHELSHILFTPRSQSDIARYVRDNGFDKAFNALEDQRIETLIVAQYQALVPWLTATMAQYLLDNPQSVTRAFPLVRGRKYLPVQIRKMVKDAFVDQTIVAELASIIDEYRLCLFPQDTERAKPLIARYAELVKSLPEVGQGEAEFDPNGHDSRPNDQHQSTVNDKPAGKREQEQARSKAQAQDAEVENEDEFQWGDEPQPETQDETEGESASNNQPADSTDSDESSEGEQGDADGESDGQDADADGQGAGAESDTPADSDQPADSEPATDNASSQTAGQGEGIKSDVLKDIINNIKQSLGETLADEIAKLGGDVVLDGVKVAEPRLARTSPELVSGETVTASVAFRTELERIKAQYDPSWEFKTRKGRLNPVRYSQGADISEVFDKFEYGRDDAVDIEAVILLDTSGSMAEAGTLAFESMWGIKRALDGVNANCTVVTFDYDAETLYRADEQASTVMKTSHIGGGTSPLKGLQYANYVLAQSDRKTKVLFTITDGVWSEAERADGIIQNLRDGGVLTSLAYIETSGRQTSIADVDAHNCEAIAHVTNPADLLTVGKSVVNLAIARNLVQA